MPGLDDKIRVSVIGCGLVAQTMHLPHLTEIEDYEIAGICDISKQLVNKIGDLYGIDPEHRFTDYRRLLDLDLDVVQVLTIYHSEIAIEAANRGINLFVEKPLGCSPAETEEIVQAAEKNNVMLMVGYMKRYDESYLYAQKLFQEIDRLKLIRSHDVFYDVPLILKGLQRVYRYDDIPQQMIGETNEKIRARMQEGVGTSEPQVLKAYRMILETGCHDINILRGAFGNPNKVLFTEIWDDGDSLVSVFDYGEGKRAVFELVRTVRGWAGEYLAAYGATETVWVRFPIPFNRNAPTRVIRRSKLNDGYEETLSIPTYYEAFKRELETMARYIRTGETPRTSGTDSLEDARLMADIIHTYLKEG